MPDDLYARALARLDELRGWAKPDTPCNKIHVRKGRCLLAYAHDGDHEWIAAKDELLRALLVERRSMMATEATVAMLNAAIRVVRELHPDVAELWAEQVKQTTYAISMTDTVLREFAGGDNA